MFGVYNKYYVKMKRLTLLFVLLMIVLSATCQKDKVFTTQVTFQQGIKFGDGTAMTTAATGVGAVTWDAITGKPATFPPATHNHSTLYKPLSYVPTWSEITSKPTFSTVAISGSYNDLINKPAPQELADALAALSGLKIPVLTQIQINSLTPVKGLILYNSTEDVLQIYTGTVWKIIISAN